jgi:glycosyltransferase involved in cell wall biosynthesis
MKAFSKIWTKFRKSDKLVFNTQRYLDENPDVQNAHLDPLRHFWEHGLKEGRVGEFYSADNPSHSSRLASAEFLTPDMKAVILRQVEADQIYSKILRSGLFDSDWYMNEYDLARREQTYPIEHFCQHGVWQGNDPSKKFSTKWYWAQYPDTVGTNPLLHYIEHGKFEGRKPAPPPGILLTAEQAFREIIDLDPGIYANERFFSIMSVPLVNGKDSDQKLKNALSKSLRDCPRNLEYLVFCPWITRGGADLVARNFVDRLAKLYGADRVALMIVDFDATSAQDWLPGEVAVINFAKHTAQLDVTTKQRALEAFIRATCPKRTININSQMIWNLSNRRPKFLAVHSENYACLFCHDYNKHSLPAGYAATHFRSAFPHLKKVFTDSAAFKADLIEQYALNRDEAQKIVVLRQFVIPIAQPAKLRRKPGSPFRILWASRICDQKNYKLLAKIIAQSPAAWTFDVWGYGDASSMKEFETLTATSKNLTLKGPFVGTEQLPLANYDAYLYTSKWDGVPTIILGVGSAGKPIVASAVGGVPEVITRETGWLINDIECANDYIQALIQVENNPKTGTERASNLQAAIKKAYNTTQFDACMAEHLRLGINLESVPKLKTTKNVKGVKTKTKSKR